MSTAWLDGVRGMASFFVFLFHYAKYGHPNIKLAYGASPEADSLIQLPIVRLIFHGRTMVSVFFIVSGYALSVSPLKLVRRRDYDALARRLSSSVFRRAIRLMLPSFAAASLHWAAQRAGLVGNPDREYVSTFYNDTAALFAEFAGQMMPFTWQTEVASLFYGPQLWTIPIEFRASMLLFVTVLGLARARTGIRMGVLAGLSVYAIVVMQWDVSLFMAGILLADVNLAVFERQSIHRSERTSGSISMVTMGITTNESHRYHQDNESLLTTKSRDQEDYDCNHTIVSIVSTSTQSSRSTSPRSGPSSSTLLTPNSLSSRYRHHQHSYSRRTTALLSAALVFGLYLASYPTQKAHTTNVYIPLYHFLPASLDYDYKSRVWTSLGAAISLAAVSFLPWIQTRVLESRAVQYLGRISYALYLTHYLLNIVLGRPLVRLMWAISGADSAGWARYEGAWLVATLVYLPVVVWVADVFWRVVDVRSVRLARRLERWCSVS